MNRRRSKASSKGEQIAAFSRTLVGTPFHWHGRVPGVGLDCVGVAVVCLDHVGIEVPLPSRYGRSGHAEMFDLYSEGLGVEKIIPDESTGLLPGDVIVFSAAKNILHVGVCTGETIVHADNHATFNRVVESSIQPEMRDRVLAIYRVKG